jgi:hypothetical protein
MTKHRKRPRDPAQLAKFIVDVAERARNGLRAATYYNFVRIHKTLRVTPAMAARVTDKLWEIGDLVKVVEQWEEAS